MRVFHVKHSGECAPAPLRSVAMPRAPWRPCPEPRSRSADPAPSFARPVGDVSRLALCSALRLGLSFRATSFALRASLLRMFHVKHSRPRPPPPCPAGAAPPRAHLFARLPPLPASLPPRPSAPRSLPPRPSLPFSCGLLRFPGLLATMFHVKHSSAFALASISGSAFAHRPPRLSRVFVAALSLAPRALVCLLACPFLLRAPRLRPISLPHAFPSSAPSRPVPPPSRSRLSPPFLTLS